MCVSQRLDYRGGTRHRFTQLWLSLIYPLCLSLVNNFIPAVKTKQACCRRCLPALSVIRMCPLEMQCAPIVLFLSLRRAGGASRVEMGASACLLPCTPLARPQLGTVSSTVLLEALTAAALLAQACRAWLGLVLRVCLKACFKSRSRHAPY